MQKYFWENLIIPRSSGALKWGWIRSIKPSSDDLTHFLSVRWLLLFRIRVSAIIVLVFSPHRRNPFAGATSLSGSLCMSQIFPIASRLMSRSGITRSLNRTCTILYLLLQALYQYCPIPLIDYPELHNELFCYVYYLRHLCDRQRFPDWEIRDPVSKQTNIC